MSSKLSLCSHFKQFYIVFEESLQRTVNMHVLEKESKAYFKEVVSGVLCIKFKVLRLALK